MHIQRPIITEKSMGLASRNWYTFAIGKHVRKEQAVEEIKKMYHVDVLTARMIAVHGKVRRVSKKMVAMKHEDWKKILVRVKPGQRIEAFEITKETPAKEAPVQEAHEAKKTDK